MTAVMAVGSALKRLPLAVWALLGGVALVLGAVWSVQAYGNARYLAGRADVLRSAQGDSATRAWAGAVVRQAEAHTDTVVRRVTVTRARVDTLWQQVPDSLRAVPEIEALRVGIVTLTTQVDTLVGALDRERAAHRVRVAVDSIAFHGYALTVVAQRDTIATLRKRPTWGKVAASAAVGMIVGAAVGFVVGVTR